MTSRGSAGLRLITLAVIPALATIQSCTCANVSRVSAVPDAGSDATGDAPAQSAYDGEAGDVDLSECEQAAADYSVAGCEYWAFSPNRLYEFGCGAVLLSNVSASSADIAVTYKSDVLDATQFMQLTQGSGPSVSYVPLTTPTIPAGQTAFMALFRGQGTSTGTAGPGCPIPTPIHGVMVPITASNDPAVGNAFHITSSVPVAAVFDHAYANIEDHGEGASALRSVGSWDTRYRDVGTYQAGRPNTQTWCQGTIGTLPTWTAAIASTTSTITLSATGNGPQAFKMIQGNVITVNQDDDFIGSVVTGTSPFAMWTSSNTEIPFNWASGDFNLLQFAPVADWASEYAAVRFPSRYVTDTTSIWRIVGDADGTVLTYDPSQPVGAPSSINAGQLVVFRTGDPFVVSSQDAAHVFHLTQLMTGCADAIDNQTCELFGPDGGEIEGCPGDPEIQSVPPAWEYTSHYAFFTDPAYPTTKLVFIRHKDSSGFHDVTLDCAGTLTGWVPIGSDDYEYVYVTLSDGNFVAQTYSSGTCDNGPHVADSTGAFSIAVWQWGTYVANTEDTDYDDISVGYLVPGLTISPRARTVDGGLPH